MTARFVDRHVGPSPADVAAMLQALSIGSLDELIDHTVPQTIRMSGSLDRSIIGDGLSEHEALDELAELASENSVRKTYLGQGYYDTLTPPVILRNLIEDPQWYTPYTPYQAEVAQGRLESLLNFQTMVTDLTGMEIANASMLDEATSAAEAMTMAANIKDHKGAFFISDKCFPQTISVVQSRAEPLGIKVIVGNHKLPFEEPVFGVLLQYPDGDGVVEDLAVSVSRIHEAGALAIVAADILALTLLRSPGECGADIAVGSTQRFGVPLGYGGPHAAYLATKDSYKRQLPGRLVGVSRDADGNPAIRLALQTREQHIRRDKATSNICTAQVLLANVAAMYAVYHGPEGLSSIANRVRLRASQLAAYAYAVGVAVTGPWFDTLTFDLGKSAATEARRRADEANVNIAFPNDSTARVSLDEATTEDDVRMLADVLFGTDSDVEPGAVSSPDLPAEIQRSSAFLTHPVFHRYHSETELMRYMSQLSNKDLSLANGIIPLGSCTMKLNAAAEMIPVSWEGFNHLHPYVPLDQAKGYDRLIERLSAMLANITGFDAVSLQPNAGSQGEYAGLLVIRAYHRARDEAHRNVCLIPMSAHGTNPASAAMVGMKIVVVKTAANGNVDVDDLRTQAEAHKEDIAALMITYPSTHGVFEDTIREVCDIVHANGGQVYMDGANMNAQVGICRPGDFGPDVCHLNLHKTFCIPHGGGGPGMGPIGVKGHLARFLPAQPLAAKNASNSAGAVSAAPFGSPSILPISYAYIRMMGVDGLRYATEVAILNANYIAWRLDSYFPVLYKGSTGFVAHECIIDLRPIKAATGVEVEDVAKRLMDYGIHAPTVSFPVAGTLMIEPTESESLAEIDRLCDALISIYHEIQEVAQGEADPLNNVLKRAPHTALQVTADEWNRPYSRTKAAYPSHAARGNKYWPPVARIDNVYGDRNVICSCPPIEDYSE